MKTSREQHEHRVALGHYTHDKGTLINNNMRGKLKLKGMMKKYQPREETKSFKLFTCLWLFKETVSQKGTFSLKCGLINVNTFIKMWAD